MTTTDHPRPPKPKAHFGPTEPITWAFYDPEHEAEMLAELTQWINWLRWRFTLDHRTIPPCWDQHGPIIEELSALYTAWQVAYTYSDDGAAPLTWMDALARARTRLGDWTARTGCRPHEHRRNSASNNQGPSD